MKPFTGIVSLFFCNVAFLVCPLASGGADVPAPQPAKNSERFELLHADLTRVEVENGVLLQILEGHVHARQDTLEIFCDRAVYNQLLHRVELEGHVLLQRGDEQMQADRVTYYQEEQKAIATGKVEVLRKDRLLRTPYLEYYYQEDRSLARGGVYIENKEKHVVVTAEAGEYMPAKKWSYVIGHAHLVQALPEQDTLHIFARRLEFRDEKPRRAIAQDSVQILQGSLEARCDSAVYFLDQELAHLEGAPVAKQGNHTGRGNRMVIQFREGEVQQISILGKAVFESPADSLSGQVNRLTGKTILAFFESGNVRQVRAIGQARSRYLFNESGGEKGINVATADTIKVFLVHNQLDSIAVLGGAEGSFYPEGVVPPPE